MRKQLFAVDVMKVMMSFFVVAFHVFGSLQGNIAMKSVFQMATRLAVPFFLLCSSYLFFDQNLNKNSLTIGVLQKYEKKIFRLLIVWSIVFIPLQMLNYSYQCFSLNAFIAYTIDFLRQGGYYHLWYLLGTVIAMPVAYLLIKKCPAVINYLIIILLLLFGAYIDGVSQVVSIPFLSEIADIYRSLFLSTKTALVFCLPYLLLGGQLAKQKRTVTPKKCIFGLMLSGLLYFLEVIMLANNAVLSTVNIYFFAMPIAAFLLLCLVQIDMQVDVRINVFLRNLSSLVYLSHPLFVFLYRDKLAVLGMFGFLLSLLSTILFSIILMFLRKRIRLLKGTI